MTSIEPSRYADGRAMLLAGLRREHALDEAARSIEEQWRAFRALGPLPGQLGPTAYGVVCGSAPDRRAFEYMCGAEVAAFDALPREIGRMRVPAQHYAVFVHDGHVATLRATWDAIWNDWVPRSGVRPADTPDFELYDERFDPRTGLGGVEIWFPVEAPGQG